MTHDSRTISAVFMAVVLILASGTAVSLAVTDSSSDVGTNAAAVQDETTTPEDGVETTSEDDAGDETQAASITFNEQETDGETVVVESVTMDEGGFIAIHDSSVQDAPLASVLGNSVYLEAGTHENVEVTLARPIEEDQTLVAMPHFDTNDNEVYDFVLSSGQLDGPYTADGAAVIDSAPVSLEAEETTTTEEEADETTTTEEEVDETTTTEEEVVETTTEEEVVETTTEEEVTEPTEEQQLVFKIEQMNVDEWSFVVGDEEEPDRTEVISNLDVQDRRVEINLTEVLQEQQQMAERQTMTTVDPEEAQEQLEENLSQDIETVRIVIRNVNVENVTLVVTAPEDVEIPEPPMTTTPVETPTEVETTPVETTPEETPTEIETTPEETPTEVETTPEETPTEIETTPEETPTEVETTPEETPTEIETTPEETPTEVETTPEETPTEVETTPEDEVELDSFDVSNLDAPESASVGETITVSATVSNPNDQQATQDVAFRLDGTVIERQSVTLDADEETIVTFEIDTTDVPAGQYIHGVYTRNFGELAVIVLEEPTEGGTGDVETTTEEADA
jgi:hypothetical protein